MLRKQRNRVIGGLLALSLLGVAVYGGFSIYNNSRSASASGVTPTVTPQVANVSTAGSISVAYTTSTALAIGSTIRLSYPTAYTGTLTTANTTVNTVAPSSVVNSSASGVTTSVITLANAITSGATVTIATSALTTPSTAGNYTFSILSSTGDTGANFQYVGSANVVQVTAVIPVSLSFVIRNTGDTANTNVCDLGTASVSSISTCSYRLKVTTNAKSGYVISMQASGDLTDGAQPIINAVAGPTGSTVTAGTEVYGASITGGSVTRPGGTVTVASAYQTSGSNAALYNNTSAATIITANRPNSPTATGDTTNTSLITHRLAISNDTPAGVYSQTVTYFVAPAF